MATYPDITNRANLDETTPAADETASKLDDAIRQHKKFFKTWSAVSFNDDGSLKTDAVSDAVQLAENVVTAATIGDNEISGAKIANYPDGVDNLNLNTDAVDARALADNAVDEASILDSAVTEDKLATDAVTEAKIEDGAVTNAKLAGGITADKFAAGAVATAGMADGSVTAAKLAVDASLSEAACGLVAVTDATGDNKLCQVGGILSASINPLTSPATLVFALSSVLSSTTSLGFALQVNQPGLTGGALNNRSLTRQYGDGVIEAGGLTITYAGTYMFIFGATGYSCGLHQTFLLDSAGTDAKICGNSAYAGIGEQNQSIGFGVINVQSDATTYTLKTFAEVSKATNGQGRLVNAVATVPALTNSVEAYAWCFVIAAQ